MTDHRADDLSYGHLGEATYDIDRKEWDFSREIKQEFHLQLVTPFRECIPASFQDASGAKKRSSHITRYHQKWLKKAHPEMFPANNISSTLDQNPLAVQDEVPSTAGALLGIGRARNVDNMSYKERTMPILTMACGKAGEVLKLVRPKAEKHSWAKGSGVKLSLLDASSAEPAHWVNTGGTIRQIAFADDEHGAGSWFAVRQDAVTTIFRPVYRKLPLPAMVPRGYPKIYPSSRLTPNPVASLKTEQPGPKRHVDVTFNPWYVRQFAVIDQLGCWAIWDLEGRQEKGSELELIAGKHGQMHQSNISDGDPEPSEVADGWHRIIWAGGVSTVVVCSRTRLTVFDVKANPNTLPSPVFVAPNSLEWILDVKRSPVNWNHLFVLTSHRIFWLQIIPAGEEKDTGNNGARILLSHRHFRDANDETTKLALLIDEEEPVVLLHSSRSPLVHFYRFFRRSDGSNQAISLQGSMILPDQEDNPKNRERSVEAICVTSARMTSNSSGNLRGEGMHYSERNIRFYQLWLLTSDLALRTSLHAMITGGKEFCENISAPPFKTAQSLQSISTRNAIGDPFVVPDGFQEEDLLEPGNLTNMSPSINRAESSDDLALRINSRNIFQTAFTGNMTNVTGEYDAEKPKEGQSILGVLDDIADIIQEGKREGQIQMATLQEIAHSENLTNDLDETEQALQEFGKSLDLAVHDEASSVLVVSNLIQSVGARFLNTGDTGTPIPSLVQIYDTLVRVWVTSLPLSTHGRTRLKKFQIIRKIALELCLSSVSISLKNNSTVSAPIMNKQKDQEDTSSYRADRRRDMTRSSSPVLMSSQTSQGTTTRTPSLYSEATSATTEPGEDPAILRLRQYAVSIKSRPDLSTGPAWLKDWPDTPGVDPASFSWETAERKSAAQELNSDDEDSALARKEEARRKRRTEKFLRRERAKAAHLASSQPASSQPASSQPSIAPFGSHPDLPHRPPFSSQVSQAIPMTQPNRGAFGSRPVKPTIKKPKKRRAAGF